MAQRSFQTIEAWVFQRLKQASGNRVTSDHYVSTHIGKGPVALLAFQDVLNKLPTFRDDGVFLAPGRAKSGRRCNRSMV